MKILWLSHVVPFPPKAGVLIRSYHLVKELARYHEIHLLAFNQRALMEPYFDSYEEGTERARRELGEFCRSIEFVDCPMDSSRISRAWCALRSTISEYPYTLNWLKSPEYQHLVKKISATQSLDLVHFDTISLAPYLDDVVNHSGAISLDHHNVESHMLVRRAELEKNALKRYYFQQEAVRLRDWEQHYCPKFHTNITCSSLDSERFREFIPSASFEAIPNGVDVDYFRPPEHRERNGHVIFIGTLDWYPNTRAVRFVAFDLWQKLRAVLPELQADIVGTNPPDDLRQFASAHHGFNVHGFVDDVLPMLAQATAYVCPINDGGGTKLKLLDALAAGKAIVADPVACEGLDLVDGETVLFAERPEEYVDQIVRLYKDDALRSRLERNAREHAVNRFAFSSIGRKLSVHFEEVVNGAYKKDAVA